MSAINIGLPFNLGAQVALDNRTVVANEAARNALVTGNRAYQGLIVYVTDQNKYYYYNGTSWIELNITGGGGSANLDFTIVSSNTNAAVNTKIGANTSAGSFTLFLPDPASDGDIIEIIDINNTFDINNLIIDPNGNEIELDTDSLTCNIKGAHFVLVFYNGNWSISVLDNNYDKAGIIQDQNQFQPLLFLRIDVPFGVQPETLLFNSQNAKNYKICWTDIQWYNTELVSIGSAPDNSKILTYNPLNKNIYIREPGLYNVDMRYASFDLENPDAFLRIRLRSSSNPIEGGLGPNNDIPDGTPGVNVFSAFAQGPIGTSFNGEAMVAGVSNFRLTNDQVPIYLVADFLHTLATNNSAFPVFDDQYGVRPFLLISKIASI